jgi:hypothetical protein
VIERVSAELRHQVVPWLRTREGVASACVSVVVFWILWAAAAAPLLTAALGAAFLTILVSLAARLWESRTALAPPAFSQISGQIDGTIELQHDPNAGFWRDSRGFLWSTRVWFVGTGCPPFKLRPDTYLRLRTWCDDENLPVFVARTRQRQWWWWRNAFYWESGDYEPEEVGALLEMLERDDEQGLGWELEVHLAGPIPEHVKRLVFDRDGGRCVACGSDELVQFDHVIPSAMGGDNRPQNLRLLCSACNRRPL